MILGPSEGNRKKKKTGRECFADSKRNNYFASKTPKTYLPCKFCKCTGYKVNTKAHLHFYTFETKQYKIYQSDLNYNLKIKYLRIKSPRQTVSPLRSKENTQPLLVASQPQTL